ncbi:MAG: hypothetical protein NWR77_06285, partial [Burkholderiaceae bacterium]|nr:hypothetical protein [Burkholderiaceae bacterium]
AQTDPKGGANFLRLLGRTLSEPSDFIRIFLASEYEEVLRRYKEALIKSLPDVPREEILWRFHFMLGATAYAIAGTDSLKLLAHEDPKGNQEASSRSKPKDKESDLMQIDRLLPRLMNFLIGGLRAPLPEFNTQALRQAQPRQAALRISRSVNQGRG